MGIRRKFSSYKDILDYVEMNKQLFGFLYIKKDMTAAKVAENQNIEYNQNFQKALLRVCGIKGKGLGGSRIGSGNKKGVKFCPNCKKIQDKCICNS